MNTGLNFFHWWDFDVNISTNIDKKEYPWNKTYKFSFDLREMRSVTPILTTGEELEPLKWTLPGQLPARLYSSDPQLNFSWEQWD